MALQKHALWWEYILSYYHAVEKLIDEVNNIVRNVIIRLGQNHFHKNEAHSIQ